MKHIPEQNELPRELSNEATEKNEAAEPEKPGRGLRVHTDRKFMRTALCAFLGVLILAAALGIFLKKPQAAPSSETAEAAETPSPTPTATPEPTTTPSESEPPETAEPETHVTALLGEEVAFYCESAEAASSAMARALSYFTESALNALPEGELVSAKYEAEPVFSPVSEEESGMTPLSESALYALLTAPESPLRVLVTVKTSEQTETHAKTQTSTTKNLPKNARAVLNMGRAGTSETVYETVFINGEPQEKTELSTSEVLAPEALSLLNGSLAVAKSNAVPGKKEGEKAPDAGELDFDSPIKGSASSNFGGRKGAFHYGLDYTYKSGASVVASESGTVAAAMEFGGYGIMIEIDHGNGFTTRYANLAEVLVTVGQEVKKGDAIATPSAEEDGFLHFEIRKDGMSYNPRFFLE